MLDVFRLLFSWLPSGLGAIALAFVIIFILVFFVAIVVKIIEIIRG